MFYYSIYAVMHSLFVFTCRELCRLEMASCPLLIPVLAVKSVRNYGTQAGIHVMIYDRMYVCINIAVF